MRNAKLGEQSSEPSIIHDGATVTSLRSNSRGNTVLGLDGSGNVHIWHVDALRAEDKATLSSSSGNAFALAVSSDWALYAVGEENAVVIKQVSNGHTVRRISFDETYVTAAAFVASGDAIIVAGTDELLTLVDLNTGETRAKAIAGERNTSIALSPDGITFALTSSWQGGSEVQFFQLRDVLTLLGDWTIHRKFDTVGPAAFDRTGGRIAFSDRDVHVYSFAPPQRLISFDVEGNRLEEPVPGFLVDDPWSEPVFTPDDRYVVIGAPTGAIFAFPLNGGESTRKIGNHDGPVTTLAMLEEGRTLVSAGVDGTVRLWAL